MRRWAGIVVLAAAVAGSAVGCSSEPETRRIELTMSGDQFVPGEVEVEAGSVAEIVITNRDTIAHEIIVGGDKTHERISSGEAGDDHGGTVVPPGETRSFVYTFPPVATTLTYGCHLDGHFEDGMTGRFVVS